MPLAVVECRWADLPTVDADTSAHAAKLHMQLTGDSAHQYSVDEGAEAQQQAQDDAGDSSSKVVVTEVQRLRYMIDSINAATAVLPKVWRRQKAALRCCQCNHSQWLGQLLLLQKHTACYPASGSATVADR